MLSAVEDLKNGFITSAMFGGGQTLIMNPPHIIISSNYIFDQDLLSKDRWEILNLENNKLTDITEKVKKREYLKKQEAALEK